MTVKNIHPLTTKTQWINDENINWLSYELNRVDLLERDSRTRWCFSTWLVERLLLDQVPKGGVLASKGLREWYRYQHVARWSKRAKLNLSSLEMIAFPINYPKGSHWILVVAFPIIGEVHYFNSMGSGSRSQSEVFMDLILRYIQDDVNQHYPLNQFTTKQWRKIDWGMLSPQQLDSSQCGVFVMSTMDHLFHKLPLIFTHEIVKDFFREKFACDIIRGHLLYQR